MTRCRVFAAACACSLSLAACGLSGSTGDETPDALLTPLPTVAGVGELPDAVAPERAQVVIVKRPIRDDGTAIELVGQAAQGNRLLLIGDSILASTATRYSGYMCDVLVPLGWAVEVEAEPSRFVDFGNRVLDKRLDPERGPDYDWDAAVVFLGSNYGSDQERFENELRMVLTRLAPRPTLLFTVTEYRPAWAEVNESVRKFADEFDNVTVVDWQELAKTPGVLSSDRLHPTDAGRRALVDLTAAALGPSSVGEGECLKSQFTDDSAVGGGSGAPASKPSGGSSGTKPPASTTTTQKPSGTTTTTPGSGGGGTGGSTTVPGSSIPGSSIPSSSVPGSSVPGSSVPGSTVPATTATTQPPVVTTVTTPPTSASTQPPPPPP